MHILQYTNKVYRIMTIFSAYTLILRTQLFGETMIEPYRVMIEPYQSVFFNKFQLNSHLYMIKYMHFEI